MKNITVKEVIIVTPRALFIVKYSMVKAIINWVQSFFKKRISNEEAIYNYLAAKYSI